MIVFYKNHIDLILSITKATLKSRYRNTLAGFIWVVLSPIITFSVQAIIFKNVLKVEMDNYYLFLLSGVMPWIFITNTLSMTVSSFISNRSTIMAFKINPVVFIVSQTLDNLINFLISFLVLLIMIGDYQILFELKLPLFFLMTAILFFTVFFFSFLLATLNVFMRDIQFILSFVINLGYFMTPIFYPIDLIPQKFHWLVNFNPIFILIKPFREIFMNPKISFMTTDILLSILVLVISIGLALLVWSKKKNDIYFNI